MEFLALPPYRCRFPVFKVANQFLLTLYRQLPLRSTLLEVKVLLQEHVEDFERTVVFPSLKGVARKIMKRNWEVDELVEQFTLLASEMTLLGNKTGSTRLGFAVLLKFFQSEGRFPEHQQEVPSAVVNQISKQVGVPTELYLQYDWNGRTIKYHRAQIREFLGFHEATVQDAQNVTDWLYQRVPEYDHKIENLQAAAKERFRQLKIEPPTQARVDRG